MALRELVVLDWGTIDYVEALQRQMELNEQVTRHRDLAFLVFCTHPPVVTVGRKVVDGDVFAWNGPLVEVSRGGRATYHGPNQQLVYPILNLDDTALPFGVRDVGQYLRWLEQSLVKVLASYNVKAAGKSPKEWVDEAGSQLETTGVWVGDKKIASLGVAVRQWVTYHGVAINIDRDTLAFVGIHPCGFRNTIMTSLEEQVGQPIERDRLKAEIGQVFKRSLSECPQNIAVSNLNS